MIEGLGEAAGINIWAKCVLQGGLGVEPVWTGMWVWTNVIKPRTGLGDEVFILWVFGTRITISPNGLVLPEALCPLCESIFFIFLTFRKQKKSCKTLAEICFRTKLFKVLFLKWLILVLASAAHILRWLIPWGNGVYRNHLSYIVVENNRAEKAPWSYISNVFIMSLIFKKPSCATKIFIDIKNTHKYKK